MKWKQLESEYVLNNKWIKVRKDKVLLNEEICIPDYYIIEKNDVALILAIDEENRIIIKKEYRYPIHENLYELPGGTLDGDEEPLQAAKRELLEETGYESKEWAQLCEFYDYPTKESNKITIFAAKNIKKVAEQKLDISEEISMELIPMNRVVEMIISGEIKVSGSVAAILLYLEKNPVA